MNNNDLMRHVAAALFIKRMGEFEGMRIRGFDEIRQRIAEQSFDDAMAFVQESLEWWKPSEPGEDEEASFVASEAAK